MSSKLQNINKLIKENLELISNLNKTKQKKKEKQSLILILTNNKKKYKLQQF